MESDRFDGLVRFMSGDASRRGVVRAGLGALPLAASAALGLSAPDEGEARHRRQAKARSTQKRSTESTPKASIVVMTRRALWRRHRLAHPDPPDVPRTIPARPRIRMVHGVRR